MSIMLGGHRLFIGRVRRYEQVKHVHVHRFLIMDSVDETIFNERTGLGRDEPLEDGLKLQI